MKSIKKVVSCLIAATIAVAAFSVPIYAVDIIDASEISVEEEQITEDVTETPENDEGTIASGTCGANLTWALDDKGTLTISGTGEMTNYESNRDNPNFAPWYEKRNNIKMIVVADGVTTIGECAFYEMDNLKEITLPESIITIKSDAFYLCKSLTNLVIPNGVKNVENYAIDGCDGLNRVFIPKSVEVFNGNGYSTGSTKYYRDVSPIIDCHNLKTIDVDPDNTNFCSVDGVMFSKDMKKLISFPAGISGSYTIPDGVESLLSYSFFGCEKLTNINIPDTVTYIGGSAFAYNGINNIKLPENLKTIGDWTFTGCNNLKSIRIPKNVIDCEGAFAWCGELKEISVDIENQKYTSIDGVLYSKDKKELVCVPALTKGAFTIPAEVECISYFAFSGCLNISSINIPNSVTHILYRAFDNTQYIEKFCLYDIYYNGTIEQWKSMKGKYEGSTIDDAFIPPFTTIHCTDGEIPGVETAPVYKIGSAEYPTLKSAYDDILKGANYHKKYIIDIGTSLTEKNLTTPKGEFTLSFTGGTLTTGSITANCDVVINCDTAPITKAINLKCAATKTITISKPGTFGTISGAKDSKLVVNAAVTAETIKTFSGIKSSAPITITKGISGVVLDDCMLSYASSLAKKIKVTSIIGKVSVDCTDKIKTGTSIFTYDGKGEFPRESVSIIDTDDGKVLEAFLYKKDVRAEIPDCLQLNGENCPSWEYALSKMNDANTDYTITLNRNLYVQKLELPAKAKSLTINGAGHGIYTEKTKVVTAKCPLTLNDIEMSLTDVINVSIKAGKFDVTLTDAYIGALTTSGKLTVNGSVGFLGAVSVGELCCNTVETYLGLHSLAVTRNGITPGSEPITLYIAKKKNGLPVEFTTDKSSNTVVKTFKLPKGGSYVEGSLLLDPACGTGILKWEKNKIILT